MQNVCLCCRPPTSKVLRKSNICHIDLFRIFQWLMTSRRDILLHTHTLWSWLQILEMGLIFCVILLFIRGEPLSKFSLKCVFWPPLSNEGSDRCSGVFVFEIFAFKVFEFIQEHCHFFHILKFYNLKPQLLSLRSLSTFPTFLSR